MRASLRMMMVTAAAFLLTGCWQSSSKPYHNMKALLPFHPGAVTEIGPGHKAQHYALTLSRRDHYRLAGTDKGDDFGEGFELRFFALPGAPANVLIYQAAALDHPINEDTLRYYGLAVLSAQGAAEIRPDCAKDAKAAKASGTAAGKDGACTFKTRAALETSLLALWKSGKTPDYIYTLK